MYERNDVETLNRAYNLFANLDGHSSERTRKKIVRMIADEEFLLAIFNPKIAADKADVGRRVAQIYDAATSRAAVSALAESLEDYGHGDMGRGSAVFLTTIVNLGMATIDDRATDLGRKKDHGEIGSSEFNRCMSKLNDYQDDLKCILKASRRIVKAKGKSLANKTGLPKELCISSLFTVPGFAYIDSAKLAFYLKTILGNLYGYVDYAADEFEYDFDEIDWAVYFKALFGSDRVADVASLILLEGVERINQYQNRDQVRACWDAITQFALKSLNKAPASLRDQLIELYLKRVNAMIANHGIDIRIDLRDLDKIRFSNLAETVKKYKDKFDAIMAKANALSNASPETAPV